MQNTIRRTATLAAPETARRACGLVLCVLLCMVFALLSGCEDATLPELDIQKVRYWSVPVDGMFIPEPRSATIGPSDELIVLDKAGRVLVYDAAGKFDRGWDMPDASAGNPQNTWVLNNGLIAVTDTHQYRVLMFNRDGEVVSQFGEHGKGDGQFTMPVAIVQDDAGFIYIGECGGNDRIQKFTQDGEHVATFGAVGTEDGQFMRLAGMTWHRGSDGAGRLYVCDAQNNRVQIFRDNGTFEGHFGPSSPNATTGGDTFAFNSPYDVEIDSDGFVYIVEWGACRVSKFRHDGTLIGVFGHPGTNKNAFRNPWGLAVNSRGHIMIADTGNHRIVELVQ